MARRIPCLALAAILATGAAAATHTTPLIDLATTIQKATDQNFNLELVLTRLLPKDKGDPADLSVSAVIADGAWRPGSGTARTHNTASHAADNKTAHPHSWAAAALGLMRNLRGRLIETRSSDPRLWCVASVDGTDPDAMPATEGQTLVVIVFNDHRRPRTLSLTVRAPTGTTFRSATTEQTHVDKQTFEIGTRAGKAEMRSRTAPTFSLTLGGRAAWKVALPLDKAIADKPEVRRTQFFSPDILQTVSRGKPFTTSVEIDAEALKGARRAWLRCVVESVAPGEGAIHIAGKAIPLPKAYTADNVTRIVELPLDPAALEPASQLRFILNPGNHAGYRVDMASIVLEARDE